MIQFGIMRTKTIIILFFLFLISCENTSKEKTWVHFSETQCMNPWDHIALDDSESKIQEYLSNNGIQIFNINIERYSYGPFCEACFCPTGRMINVEIQASDTKQARILGFYK